MPARHRQVLSVILLATAFLFSQVALANQKKRLLISVEKKAGDKDYAYHNKKLSEMLPILKRWCSWQFPSVEDLEWNEQALCMTASGSPEHISELRMLIRVLVVDTGKIALDFCESDINSQMGPN